MRLLDLGAATVLFVAGCSSASGNGAPTTPPTTDGCQAEATRCSGLQVQTCTLADGQSQWSAPTDCSDGQVCREGTGCVDLTADEQSRLNALHTLLTESQTKAARAAAVDYAGIESKLRVQLLTSDGSDHAYIQSLWDAMLSLPQGHQGLDPATKPGSSLDFETAAAMGFAGAFTIYGTCLSPYRDHAVVMHTNGDLHAGDEIVAIDGKRGADLQAWVIEQPIIDLLPPTTTGRFAFAIRAFLGHDRKGTKLTIVRPGASGESEITLPAGGSIASGYSCYDPLLRDPSTSASSLLPDGTGLLYIPGFWQKSVADFESEVGPLFDKVKAAPRLIIDLRSNSGGNLQSALDLVGQLPGAKSTSYVQFYKRTPNTEPPKYSLDRTVSVASSSGRFAYTGRVAVLVDGATFSSGEHFVLAARASKASVVVIGTKSAGAYGNTSADTPTSLFGNLQVKVNRSQVRTMEGKILDGISQEPDIVVEYEPAAIAAGRDPMIERAVAELSK